MKLSKKLAGFCVSVSKGRDHRTHVPNLVSEMLHEVLARAGAEDGLKFAYQATGTFHSLSSTSKYAMSISPEQGRKIRINMKYDKAQTSTVTGLLHLPVGVELRGMFEKLKCAAAELNKEQWKSLGGSADADESSSAPKAKPAHVQLVVNHMAPASGGVITQADLKHEEETMRHVATAAPSETKASDQNDDYAVILMDILELTKKPEFTIKGAAPAMYKHFPGKKTHGLASGVMMKLRSFGWIRRVSTEGLWQVEAGFLAEYKLDMVVKPFPVCDFAKRKAYKTKTVKKVKVVKTAIETTSLPTHSVPVVHLPVVDNAPQKVSANADILSRIILLQEMKRELELALKGVSVKLESVAGELEALTESLTREELLKIVLDTLK